MGDLIPQKPVYKSPEHCACQKDYEDGIATSHKNKHGSGANSGQGPTQSEYDSTYYITLVGWVFRIDIQFLSLYVLPMKSFDQLDSNDPNAYGAENDPKHVERLEMEHFKYSEPAYGFRFVKSYSKDDPDHYVFKESHG